jgi:hypothetical protein
MPVSDEEAITQFWDALLSRRPAAIRAVFQPLDAATRRAVAAHLQKMASEDGWHPEQRQSAQAALDALGDLLEP